MNMESPLQNTIQKMGNNFLVAAFVPSMAFIVISFIAFDFLLPSPLKLLVSKPEELLQSGFYLLLFTTILGFTLFSLSTYIYKAFEGYTFILGKETPLRRSFLKRQKRRFLKNENERAWVENQIARINIKIDKEGEYQETAEWHERRQKRYLQRREALYDQQYTLASERNENFPPSLDLILPTRFGNLLRSAEMYPGSRYGIDAVPLWGRLIHVIPEDGMAKIDEANNQCLFLLNAALLAGIFTIFCIITFVYQIILVLTNWCSTDCVPEVSPRYIILFLFLAVLAGGIAWLFYSASLLNVGQYGDMICSAYDLYRFNLIQGLHLNLPENLQEERILWRRVSYFMVGNEQWERLNQQDELQRLSSNAEAGFVYNHQNQGSTK